MIFRTIGGKVRPMPNLLERRRARRNRERVAPGSLGSFRTFRSFTTPNANCPVCGVAVWFYQSPHGGRVFFDEIGPPWPKHPCTDSKLQNEGRLSGPRLPASGKQKNTRQSRRRLRDKENLAWYSAGWRPGFHLKLESLDQVALKVSFSLRDNGRKQFSGFLHKAEIRRECGPVDGAIDKIRKGLVFYRVEDGVVKLAVLDENARKYYLRLYKSKLDMPAIRAKKKK